MLIRTFFSAVALLAVFFLSACNKQNPAQEILGAWVIDSVSIHDAALSRLQGEERERLKTNLEMAENVFRGRVLQFSEDKFEMFENGSVARSGKYEMVPDDHVVKLLLRKGGTIYLQYDPSTLNADHTVFLQDDRFPIREDSYMRLNVSRMGVHQQETGTEAAH